MKYIGNFGTSALAHSATSSGVLPALSRSATSSTTLYERALMPRVSMLQNLRPGYFSFSLATAMSMMVKVLEVPEEKCT